LRNKKADMIIIDGKEFEGPMTDEKFDELWKQAKEDDERLAAELNALSPEEKMRRFGLSAESEELLNEKTADED